MDQKQQIADRLRDANNILVTVSNNPSVDQLAACMGLTLALNKLGKHATAVFSGEVPSTIEFLQPEKTIEKDTNSLRDFIIALDKSKADKLRYKVEDKVVKIFITPYRTSISEKDLDFSQGDFNVDVVIALGVHAQTELDQAITSHGRILHDATIATVNVKPGGELGSMNWLDPGASSLSELVVQLIDTVDKHLIDNQIATALLTGIVAETARFSNEKTTPATMSVSAELMSAGANQQLVATKLDMPVAVPEAKPAEEAPKEAGESQESKPADGMLEIDHPAKPKDDKPAEAAAEPAGEPPKPEEKPEEQPPETPDDKPEAEESAEPAPTPIRNLHDLESENNASGSGENSADDQEIPLTQIKIDEQGALHNIKAVDDNKPEQATTDPTQNLGGSRMILQPPAMGGQMNSDGMPNEGQQIGSDPLSLPNPTDPAHGSSPSYMPPASATTAPPQSSTPYMPASMTPSNPAPFPQPSTPAPEPPKPEPTGPAGVDPAAIAPFGLPPSPEPVPAAFGADQPPQSDPAAFPPEDGTHVDNARNAVTDAIAGQSGQAAPEPIVALNAQPLGDLLHGPTNPSGAPPVPELTAQPAPPPPPPASPADLFPPDEPQNDQSQDNQFPPPPVPPPMMPPPAPQ